MYEKIKQAVLDNNIPALERIALLGTVNVTLHGRYIITDFAQANNHAAVDLLIQFGGSPSSAIRGYAMAGNEEKVRALLQQYGESDPENIENRLYWARNGFYERGDFDAWKRLKESLSENLRPKMELSSIQYLAYGGNHQKVQRKLQKSIEAFAAKREIAVLFQEAALGFAQRGDDDSLRAIRELAKNSSDIYAPVCERAVIIGTVQGWIHAERNHDQVWSWQEKEWPIEWPKHFSFKLTLAAIEAFAVNGNTEAVKRLSDRHRYDEEPEEESDSSDEQARELRQKAMKLGVKACEGYIEGGYYQQAFEHMVEDDYYVKRAASDMLTELKYFIPVTAPNFFPQLIRLAVQIPIKWAFDNFVYTIRDKLDDGSLFDINFAKHVHLIMEMRGLDPLQAYDWVTKNTVGDWINQRQPGEELNDRERGMHEKIKQAVLSTNTTELRRIAFRGTVNVISQGQYSIFFFARENNHEAVELLLQFNGSPAEAIQGYALAGNNNKVLELLARYQDLAPQRLYQCLACALYGYYERGDLESWTQLENTLSEETRSRLRGWTHVKAMSRGGQLTDARGIPRNFLFTIAEGYALGRHFALLKSLRALFPRCKVELSAIWFGQISGLIHIEPYERVWPEVVKSLDTITKKFDLTELPNLIYTFALHGYAEAVWSLITYYSKQGDKFKSLLDFMRLRACEGYVTGGHILVAFECMGDNWSCINVVVQSLIRITSSDNDHFVRLAVQIPNELAFEIFIRMLNEDLRTRPHFNIDVARKVQQVMRHRNLDPLQAYEWVTNHDLRHWLNQRRPSNLTFFDRDTQPYNFQCDAAYFPIAFQLCEGRFNIPQLNDLHCSSVGKLFPAGESDPKRRRLDISENEPNEDSSHPSPMQL